MKIKMLFVDRTGYGTPELIAAVDELCYEDNPGYLEGEIEKVRAQPREFDGYAVIEADIDEDMVKKALSRQAKVDLTNQKVAQ